MREELWEMDEQQQGRARRRSLVGDREPVMNQGEDGQIVYDYEIGPFIGERKPTPERIRRPLGTRRPLGGARPPLRGARSPQRSSQSRPTLPIAGAGGNPGSLGEDLKKFWAGLKNGERYALVAGSIGAGILLLASTGKGEGAKLKKI